jgi:hypothetical protein
MLRLNHPRFNTLSVRPQEPSQCQQCAVAHIRQAPRLHPAAKPGVEHPLRDLQRCRCPQFVSHTTKNNASAPARAASNPNNLPIPGMPAVGHFSGVGFMGVLYPSCITGNDHTARWLIERRSNSDNKQAMQMWKAKNASHIYTATTAKKRQSQRQNQNENLWLSMGESSGAYMDPPRMQELSSMEL